MIGLVIPIYNRPEYVRRCFDSLLKATEQPDLIVLVDDCSSDASITPIIDWFRGATSCPVHVITHQVNSGIRESLLTGISAALHHIPERGVAPITTIINLDSDAIVKPNFITTLTNLFKEHKQKHIVSGFNCETSANPILQYCDGYATKAYGNGINMCFDKELYEKYIKPSLLIDGNWDYNTSLACQKDKLPFIITTPSVVQHIGVKSSMGHVGGDFAKDFKQLHLPDVTLFGIDAHDPAGITRAAEISQRDIEFGHVNIITQRLFSGREAYSNFIIKNLAPYIETSHVLIIHADGYVINWEAWDDSWLQYDYIGATWWYKDNMNVGNGGFSLRSKRLQEILAQQQIPQEYIHPEDHCICRIYRESLERDFGIKFAPEEVANSFSIEAYNTPENRYCGSFGFHGVHVVGLPSDIAYKRPSEPRAEMVAPVSVAQSRNRIQSTARTSRPNQSRHNPNRKYSA